MAARILAALLVLAVPFSGAGAAVSETRVDTAVVVGTPRTTQPAPMPTSYGAPSRTAPDPGLPPQETPSATRTVAPAAASTYQPAVTGGAGRDDGRKFPWIWLLVGAAAGVAIYQASK